MSANKLSAEQLASLVDPEMYDVVESKLLDSKGDPYIYIIPKIKPVERETVYGFDLRSKRNEHS